MRHRDTCEKYAKERIKFVWQFPTAKMTNDLTILLYLWQNNYPNTS